MKEINDKCCVKEALNGLLVDLFLQCSAIKNLAATLQIKCDEHGIQSDHCHQKENLIFNAVNLIMIIRYVPAHGAQSLEQLLVITCKKNFQKKHPHE